MKERRNEREKARFLSARYLGVSGSDHFRVKREVGMWNGHPLPLRGLCRFSGRLSMTRGLLIARFLVPGTPGTSTALRRAPTTLMAEAGLSALVIRQ